MVNSTSIGIYKMKPPSLMRSNKPNSMIQLRYLKQTNSQNQNQINSYTPNQNGKDFNNISNLPGDQNQSQQKLKWEMSSQINAQNNFRISATSQKQPKSKSVTNLPVQQQNATLHSFVGRNSKIMNKNNNKSNKKDLQTMIGVSFQASQGLETLCENALFKKQVDELKLSSNTPQKLISNLKSEIRQQSKLEFSHCYSQEQSNSFYNSENGDQVTPQRQRNFSNTHQDLKKSIYSKESTQNKESISFQKLNKSEIALPQQNISDSNIQQAQVKPRQGSKRPDSRRRYLLSQQDNRKKIIDEVIDTSFPTQDQSKAELKTKTQNQFKEILGNKNNNSEKNIQNKFNNTLNQSTEQQGFTQYSQNKIAAMISRDNSNLVNQSLQLLNTLRKKSQNLIDEKSPITATKLKSQNKYYSQGSTQHQTRLPSQHQENRHAKNGSQFSMKNIQNGCESDQKSGIILNESQMDQSDILINKYRKAGKIQNMFNPSKQLLVNQFLKEKTINSKDWPKLREKIYYTLCQKGFNNNKIQSSDENVQNYSTSKHFFDEAKQSSKSQKQITRNNNQINLFQQNILSSFLDSKDPNDSQSQITSNQIQTKNTVLASTKNTLNLQSQLSIHKQNNQNKEKNNHERPQSNSENNLYFNSVNNQMRPQQQNKNNGTSIKNINNSPITSFNDQLNHIQISQIKSLDTTPINKKQYNPQTFNQFSSSQQNITTNSQLKTNAKFKLDLTKINQGNDFSNPKAQSARIYSQNEISHQSQHNQQKQNDQIKSARINNNQDNLTNTPINSSYFKGATHLPIEQEKPNKQIYNEATPSSNKVKKSISFLSTGKPASSQNKVSFQQKVNSYNQMNFIQHVDNISQNSPSNQQYPNNDKNVQASFMSTTSKSQFQKKHSIMNSLCLIQLKKIKQKVSEEEKAKFQNFFNDIINTQNMLKYQKDTPIDQIAPEFKLHQIKYIPRGNKELFENKNLTNLFRKEIKDYNLEDIPKPSAIQMETIEKEEYENYLKFQKIQQEYEDDKYYIHTNEPNLRQELTSLIEKKQKENEKVSTTVKFEIGNIISPKTQKKFELSLANDSKWKRIRKDMIEFVLKVQKLNLTIDEVVDNKLFTQTPYSREGSEILFNFIKTNNYEGVYECLKKDKYLVYTYDKGMNTPLQIACKRGFSKIAQILIEQNSDLDHMNQVKKTALYYSCSIGDISTALFLIKNKANPWSDGKCSLNQYIHQFGDQKEQINAAKRIHFMMNLLPLGKKQKLWDEFQYIFKAK